MKKSAISAAAIVKILIFSFLMNAVSPFFAEDAAPLPYDKTATPQTLKDLRRFEIITLGALPFVTLDVGIAYSGIKWANNNFDANYSPNPFAVSSYSTEEQMGMLLASAGISVGIALTDYVVNLIKRSKKKKRERLENSNIFIAPLSEDKNAFPIIRNDENFYEKKESGANAILNDNDNSDFSGGDSVEQIGDEKTRYFIFENQDASGDFQEIFEAEE